MSCSDEGRAELIATPGIGLELHFTIGASLYYSQIFRDWLSGWRGRSAAIFEERGCRA